MRSCKEGRIDGPLDVEISSSPAGVDAMRTQRADNGKEDSQAIDRSPPSVIHRLEAIRLVRYTIHKVGDGGRGKR